MNYIFPIPVQITNLKYDFTELRKDKNHSYNFTQKDKIEIYDYAKVRILENYPDLKKVLLEEVYKYTKQLGFTNKYVITTSVSIISSLKMKTVTIRKTASHL